MTQLFAVCCLTILLAVHALSDHHLPAVLLTPPQLHDYAHLKKLTGLVPNPAALKLKPRVVIGYLADKDWSFIEFLCMLHSSWNYVHQSAADPGVKIDLLVFSHTRWREQISSVCQPLNLETAKAAGYGTVLMEQSQCFVVFYPTPPESIWFGYPFINNVHYFADPLVANFLSNYGYALKTDLDAFLTPALLDHYPEKLEMGEMEYVLLPATAGRLDKISADLRLDSRSIHNLGPTWYGDVQTLVTLANFTIPILHHIVSKEFAQRPEGGIAQEWSKGEGWPEWNAGAAAMYATEIAVNHLIEDFAFDTRYDRFSDSEGLVTSVFHIHCRHGSKDFNKIEFLTHHYDHVSLTKNLDMKVIKDYAMIHAITTWRQLRRAQQRGQQREL